MRSPKCLKVRIILAIEDPEVFKNHQLPLARVKKIMKSDEDVRVLDFVITI